jgi:hypothetical protein
MCPAVLESGGYSTAPSPLSDGNLGPFPSFSGQERIEALSVVVAVQPRQGVSPIVVHLLAPALFDVGQDIEFPFVGDRRRIQAHLLLK